MSESPRLLNTFLQVHLADDRLTVLHLPYVLSHLTSEALRSSEHAQKWISRINSLVLSRHGGSCWAGLCIALQTANLSRDLMLECAQTWVGVTIPLLSQPESAPTLKAAIRLTIRIFTGAMDVPEYQRQVCIPNVPKFSIGLLSLGEKIQNTELKVLIYESLSHLVSIYPSLLRASQTALTNFALAPLNGSAPQAHIPSVVEAASRLNSVLHYMGGKVAAATQWRKSVDDTLSFCWASLSSIRTTFPSSNSGMVSMPVQGDPVIDICLNLDRLRVGVLVLRDLMYSSNPRPVILPVGHTVKLCTALLRCSTTDVVDGHVDPLIRTLELSVTPQVLSYGCELVDALVNCAGPLLAPHYTQFLFHITHHLEQSYPSSHRLYFLRSAQTILTNSSGLHEAPLLSRLARAILPSITILLSRKTDVQAEGDVSIVSPKNRKGKKRSRGYEGDEVFKLTRTVICTSEEDGKVITAALSVLQIMLEHGSLSPSSHSIVARVVLSLYIALPHLPSSLLSADKALHHKIRSITAAICAQLGRGTTSVMSKSLGLVIGTSMQNTSTQIFSELDVLLHPRVPPLVRPLPHVELLSLFRAEESQEELLSRQALRLGSHYDSPSTVEDTSQPSPPKGKDHIGLLVHPQSAVSSLTHTLLDFSSSKLTLAAPTTQSEVTLSNFGRQTAESGTSNRPTFEPAVTVLTRSSSSPLVIPPLVEEQQRMSLPQAGISETPADVRGILADLEDEDEAMPSIDVGSDTDSS